MFSGFVEAAQGLAIARDVAAAREAFRSGRLIETLKGLRALFPMEAPLSSSQGNSTLLTPSQ